MKLSRERQYLLIDFFKGLIIYSNQTGEWDPIGSTGMISENFVGFNNGLSQPLQCCPVLGIAIWLDNIIDEHN